VAGGARVVGGAQGAAFPVGVFAVEGDGYRAAARVADVRRGQRPAVRVVLEVVDGQCSGGGAGGGTVGGAGTGAVRGGDPQVIGGVGPEVDGWGVAGGPQPGDVDDRVGQVRFRREGHRVVRGVFGWRPGQRCGDGHPGRAVLRILLE